MAVAKQFMVTREVTGVVKGTHVQAGRVGVEVGADRLLGLEGLTVVRVELDAQGGRVVHAVTAQEFEPGCPKCGVISTSLKGSFLVLKIRLMPPPST